MISVLVFCQKAFSVEISNESLAHEEARGRMVGLLDTKSVNQGSNLSSACLLVVHDTSVSVMAPQNSQHSVKARCDFVDDPLNLIRPRQLVNW